MKCVFMAASCGVEVRSRCPRRKWQKRNSFAVRSVPFHEFRPATMATQVRHTGQHRLWYGNFNQCLQRHQVDNTHQNNVTVVIIFSRTGR